MKEEGFYIGKETSNRKPMFLKYQNINKNNSFNMGSAGQGMSFYAQSQIISQVLNEESIIITDPKNELN